MLNCNVENKLEELILLTMDDIIREGHPTLRARAEKIAFPLSDEDLKLLDIFDYGYHICNRHWQNVKIKKQKIQLH